MSENGVGEEAAIRTGPPIVKFEELALLQKVATNTPPTHMATHKFCAAAKRVSRSSMIVWHHCIM
jgi:hypothetical protein